MYDDNTVIFCSLWSRIKDAMAMGCAVLEYKQIRERDSEFPTQFPLVLMIIASWRAGRMHSIYHQVYCIIKIIVGLCEVFQTSFLLVKLMIQIQKYRKCFYLEFIHDIQIPQKSAGPPFATSSAEKKLFLVNYFTSSYP